MPNPPTRTIYLPNYKVAVDVPSNYTDDMIDDAVRRNKATIQQQSPVYQANQANINQNLSSMGVTEQQARAQGLPNVPPCRLGSTSR